MFLKEAVIVENREKKQKKKKKKSLKQRPRPCPSAARALSERRGPFLLKEALLGKSPVPLDFLSHSDTPCIRSSFYFSPRPLLVLWGGPLLLVVAVMQLFLNPLLTARCRGMFCLDVFLFIRHLASADVFFPPPHSHSPL